MKGSALGGAASATPFGVSQEVLRRFRLSCRLLRNAGHLDLKLPGQRSESLIDFLVIKGVAVDKYAAAEALITAKQLLDQLNWLIQEGIDTNSVEVSK